MTTGVILDVLFCTSHRVYHPGARDRDVPNGRGNLMLLEDEAQWENTRGVPFNLLGEK